MAVNSVVGLSYDHALPGGRGRSRQRSKQVPCRQAARLQGPSTKPSKGTNPPAAHVLPAGGDVPVRGPALPLAHRAAAGGGRQRPGRDVLPRQIVGRRVASLQHSIRVPGVGHHLCSGRVEEQARAWVKKASGA